MNALGQREHIMGGLWGAVVGDALGVPVAFKSRDELRADPVREMRGGGTWHQPPGTWSDESSLLLCTAESLLHGFDPDDMARRYGAWLNGECWTPWGTVFDVGMTTRCALERILRGVTVAEAAATGERSNGNGALIRVVPLTLRYWHEGDEALLHRAHRTAAITHGHPRSQMACGLFALLLARLLQGVPLPEAAEEIRNDLDVWYDRPPFDLERDHFRLLANGRITELTHEKVASSGYVIDTLAAGIWCATATQTFADAVLGAVNLGGDADTTAAVAGSLAGVAYGQNAIPEPWQSGLARRGDLAELFERFALACLREAPA